jgi:preprotein translocase subunit SecD
MNRGWYFRFSLVLVAILGAWVALWPTFDRLGWVGAPEWVTENVETQITPGLDIQGGLRLMYSVDMDAAIEDRMQARAQQLLRQLGEKLDIVEEGEAPDEEELEEIRQRVSARIGTAGSRVIRLDFRGENAAQDAEAADHDLIGSFGDLREESRTETAITLVLRDESVDQLREVAVNQAQETIKNRIAELGISEANVRARDIDISVEVPGASEADFDRIRDIISQTARLEFKIVDDGNSWVRELDDVPEGIEVQSEPGVSAGEDRPSVTSYNLYAEGPGPCPEGVEPPEGEEQCTARARLLHYVSTLEDRLPEGRSLAIGRVDRPMLEEEAAGAGPADEWRTYLLYDTPPDGSDPVGGEHLEDASVTTDPGPPPQPVVSFTMTTAGARLMQDLTEGNLKRRMAVVLDDEVASAPVIQSRIGARGQITLGGVLDVNQAYEEANELVIVLRAGALPAPIIPQNEQLIGPTLGRDSVQQGALGAVIGITLVLIFMAFYYQVAGLVADTMVLLNVLFLFGIMAFFNNDLTLPGIAGIALTVGMAVDANVLITERMREELRMGKSARAAVRQGFSRAFWSIFDSQLTTFIAGVVLYQYGSPEIQGFAKTLMIGIVTSLFTGIFCSKVMFDWLVEGLKVQRLRVG